MSDERFSGDAGLCKYVDDCSTRQTFGHVDHLALVHQRLCSSTEAARGCPAYLKRSGGLEVQTEQLPTIEPRDIRRVMERYNEALTDLGGVHYAPAFAEWIGVQEPTKYKAFVDREGDSPADCLALFDPRSFCISLDQHDGYLAAFASQNADANAHIRGLLADMDVDE